MAGGNQISDGKSLTQATGQTNQPLKKARSRSILSRDIGLPIALIIIMIIFSFLSEYFLTVENFQNVARAVAITGIAAAVSTIVLVSGGFDLSISAVMAMSGMFTAALLGQGWALVPAIVAGLLSGALLGALNGAVVVYIGINPLITTIGTQFVARGLAYVLGEGRSLVISAETGFRFFGQSRLLDLSFSVYLMAATFLVVWFYMTYTRWGRHIYAIGGNESAAERAGVRTKRLRFGIYVLSGVGSAFAGLLLSSQAGSAFPYAATGFELTIISAVILGGASLQGGRGTVIGTLLGVFILGFLRNGLNLMGAQPYIQDFATGIALLLAVSYDEFRRVRRSR
ncbi:MAG: ABC transporter permease [Anaerolineae bacterium]|nr:ABC transporter permease [Anaerolineae bacterium]